jgi:hypothetical protein
MRVKIAIDIDFDERVLNNLPDTATPDLRQAYDSVLKSKPKDGTLYSSFFDVPFRFNEGDIIDNIIPLAFKQNNDISYYSLGHVLRHLDRTFVDSIEFDHDIDGIYQIIWVIL